jgi:hypothetical protein
MVLGICIVLVYVAVPEKYFTPASGWSLHDIRLSSFTGGGAPQFGGKRRSHGPTTPAEGVAEALNANVLPAAVRSAY